MYLAKCWFHNKNRNGNIFFADISISKINLEVKIFSKEIWIQFNFSPRRPKLQLFFKKIGGKKISIFSSKSLSQNFNFSPRRLEAKTSNFLQENCRPKFSIFSKDIWGKNVQLFSKLNGDYNNNMQYGNVIISCFHLYFPSKCFFSIIIMNDECRKLNFHSSMWRVSNNNFGDLYLIQNKNSSFIKGSVRPRAWGRVVIHQDTRSCATEAGLVSLSETMEK